jgi:hypothetical protein
MHQLSILYTIGEFIKSSFTWIKRCNFWSSMERVIAILVEVAQATKLCVNPEYLCVCWSFSAP